MAKTTSPTTDLRIMTVPANEAGLPAGRFLRWEELRVYLAERGQDDLIDEIEATLNKGEDVFSRTVSLVSAPEEAAAPVDAEAAEAAEELARWISHGFDAEEAASWIEADLTIDQALGWRDHGCGPGDASGCWTQDPDEAFAEPDADGEDED